MPTRKVKLSIEADKLTLGITEDIPQRHSFNATLNSIHKILSLLEKCSLSTKLLLIALSTVPITTFIAIR